MVCKLRKEQSFENNFGLFAMINVLNSSRECNMKFLNEERELECFDKDSIADEVEDSTDETDLKQLAKT